MNVSFSKKKKQQNVARQFSDQEKEMLKAQRRLNKKKKKNKKEAKRKKSELRKIQKTKTTEEHRNHKIEQKLKKEQKKIKQFSNNISNWLNNEQINSIAIVVRFVKRVNLKILPLPFLLTLAYGMYGDGGTTLIMLAANMKDWFGISITPQALSERMSKIESVKFFKKILIQAMAQQISNGFKNRYAEIFKHFENVKLEDSTQFKLHEKVAKEFKGCGGSASTSAMKLNVVYNITEHVVSELDIVAGSIPDQALSKKVAQRIKKGVLWIRDLGYFSISDMSMIIKLEGFFLSRLKKGINIFLNQNDESYISMNAFLEDNTKNSNSFDKDVYIGEKNDRIKVRLIGEKVPEEVKQKRIKNYKNNVIKRDNKKKMNGDYVTWFGYSIFVTNIPREMLASATIIMTVYKIRWQIELFFKRIKSLLQINIIKGESGNRVKCLIYSKLISLLMSQSITSYAAHICDENEEVSEYKVMQWLQTNNRLGKAVIEDKMESLLKDIILNLYLLIKNKRRKVKSTLRTIEEVFFFSSIKGDCFYCVA